MASGLLSDNGLKDQQAQKDSDGPDLQKEKKKKKKGRKRTGPKTAAESIKHSA